jgi:glutamyl-tRNA synthetase
MAWLGMHADEGPYFQSARMDLYKAKLAELVARGGAYKCWCTKEHLEERRAFFDAQKKPYRYERTCRGRDAGPTPDAPYVIRAAIPAEGKVVMDDLILGEVVIDNRELDDFVLARADGSPVYNFCVVVDDIDMRITHVVRGVDHLANTPKQIHLYDLFGVPRPRFGHLPMIHGMDGKKLSKRHGAASIMQFKDLGYLPETMLSFLARLGWSHGDQEMFEVDELQRLFDLSGCGKSAAIFDMKKLDWQNGTRLRQLSPVALLERTAPFLAARGLATDLPWLPRAVVAVQERARTLVEVADGLALFYDRANTVKLDEKAAAKFLTPENRATIVALADALAAVPAWLSRDLEAAATAFLSSRGLEMKAIGQPARVALTGGTVSPPLFDCMEIFGRDVTLSRLRAVAA